MTLKNKLLLAILVSGSVQSVFAQGLLENDANLRDDLNWLNQQGVIQISTSTWPLSSDAVNTALQNAQVTTTAQKRVINEIQKKLQLEGSTLKFGLNAKTDKKYIPQTFADNDVAKGSASFEYNAGGENWDVKLRANGETKQVIKNGDNFNVEGSYVAGKLKNQWIAFGQIPTWWGPGHDGSLIRGDASRPVTGFTMQRAEQNAFESKWLSWIGPWQYQLFAGQLQDYQAVPDARLLGMRLTLQPLPYLELGASRVIQIGGKGQPDSLNAYWNAVIGNDNNCDINGCVNNKNASNQLAGVDFRLNLQKLFNVPVGIYGQLVGEDEAGGLPSQNLYLAGTDFSSSYRDMPYQIYAEWADTRSSGDVLGYTYNHHQYKDGFYQNGYPLADSMGGDGQMYSLGGNIRIDPVNRLSARILQVKVNQSSLNINKAFTQNDKIKALDLSWTNTLRPNLSVKVSGWLSDSDLYGHDTGGSVALEIGLDDLFKH